MLSSVWSKKKTPPYPYPTWVHSWAQRKLSPLSLLSLLNIMLSINGPLLSLGFNPNPSGIPADSKEVACWYFNTKWCWSFNTNYLMPRLWYCKKWQKHLTLRALLRYLENSDQCINFTSCSSFYARSRSKNLGQSL